MRMPAKILSRPEDQSVRWPFQMEDGIQKGLAHHAIRATFGWSAFTESRWDEVAGVVNANTDELLRELNSRAPADDSIACEATLIVLQGAAGPPPACVPRWLFEDAATYSASDRSDAGLYAQQFAFRTLQPVVKQIQADAASHDNTYVVELDRVTTCGQNNGELEWQSSLVVLVVRRRCLVPIFLSVLEQNEDGLVVIAGVDLAGSEVAQIRSHSGCMCAKVSALFAEQCGLPSEGLNFVWLGDTISNCEDDRTLFGIISALLMVSSTIEKCRFVYKRQ